MEFLNHVTLIKIEGAILYEHSQLYLFAIKLLTTYSY